jgi:hypothetical protein
VACGRLAVVDRDRFWELVDAAHEHVSEPDEVAAAVVGLLVETSAEEIVGVELELNALLSESYRWDLWAAAYLINGGASAEGFDNFRGWLLTRGRTVWEAAVADPDSLADVVSAHLPSFLECEDMVCVAVDAYGQVTGDDEGLWAAVAAVAAHIADDGEPGGEKLSFDDPTEMRSRLPRLWALTG